MMVRILFLEAPLESDDTGYFAIAEHYSGGFLGRMDHQLAFRSGMVLPLRTLNSLFGYSIGNYYAFSLFFYGLLIVGVYLLSSYAVGVRMAVYACLIVFTSTLVLYQTSNVLPDIPFVAPYLISCFLFFRAGDESVRYRASLLVLAASVFAFYAYTVRLTNSFLWIAFPVYEVIRYRRLSKTMLFGVVFLVLLVGELLYFYFLTGDPLIRFRMIFSGVSSWSVHMQPLKVQEYLFQPITNYVRFYTGWVLLVGGLLGWIVAIVRRNLAFMVIGVSGLVLFGINSYSITSLDPLVRAIPLQYRYIVGVSVIFGMLTAYLFESGHHLISRVGAPSVRYGLVRVGIPVVVFVVSAVQIAELPKTISGGILMGNDHYFLADRMMRSFGKSLEPDRILYVYPEKDFRLYPSFARLKVQHYTPGQELSPSDLILYSKRRIKTDLAYGRKVVPASLEVNFLGKSPEWDYLFDTGQVVLARVTGRKVKAVPIANLATGPDHFSTWFPQKFVADPTSSSIRFELPPSDHHYYLQTNAGSYNVTPDSMPGCHPMVGGSVSLKVEMKYLLSSDLESLGLFLCQYNSAGRNRTTSVQITPRAGLHSITHIAETDPDTVAFRILLRIDNRSDCSLELKNLSVEAIHFPSDSP